MADNDSMVQESDPFLEELIWRFHLNILFWTYSENGVQTSTGGGTLYEKVVKIYKIDTKVTQLSNHAMLILQSWSNIYSVITDNWRIDS